MRGQIQLELLFKYFYAILIVTIILLVLLGLNFFSPAKNMKIAELENFIVEDFSMATNGTLKLILLNKMNEPVTIENFITINGVTKQLISDSYILFPSKKIEVTISNSTDEKIKLNQTFDLKINLNYYKKSKLKHISHGRVKGIVEKKGDFIDIQNGTLFLNGSFERTIFEDNKIKLNIMPRAITVYYDSLNPNASRFRIWNGTHWGNENTTNDVGGWVNYQTILEAAPNRREFIMGNVDNLMDLNLQIWNGSWSSPIEVTNNTVVNTMRNFDVKYEQISGRAIAVYKTWTGTTNMSYRIWNGSSWSNEMQYIFGGTNSPRLVSLIEKPNSNNIMCLVVDNNRDLFAREWNGSSWSSVTTLELNTCTAINGRKCFDFVYLDTYGLIAYQKNNSLMPYYRLWNGSNWSDEFVANSVENTTQWLKLAKDMSSNNVIMATLDSASDLNVQIWNGSSWSNVIELNARMETITQRSFDVIFFEPNKAMIVYGVSTYNWPNYRIWNGVNWSSQLNASNVGGDSSWIKLEKNNFNNKLLLSVLENEGADYSVQEWNGTTWTNYYELETESNHTNSNFDTKYEKIIFGSYEYTHDFYEIVEINEMEIVANGIKKYQISNNNINWSQWVTFSSNSTIINQLGRYIKYNITLNSTNQTMPVIESVKIKYKR